MRRIGSGEELAGEVGLWGIILHMMGGELRAPVLELFMLVCLGVILY